MSVRRLLVGGWLIGALSLGLAESLPEDLDNTLASLQQVAADLTDTVKTFQTHLDREIALHDHGYRSPTGGRVPGADSDLRGGPSDLGAVALRRLFAARMISSRRPGYAPPALEDADRLQSLIMEARNRVDVGSDMLRRLFIVSAKVLNSPGDTQQALRIQELTKARNAAVAAAKKALLTLPISLPQADSQERQRQSAWDILVAKHPVNVTLAAHDSNILPIRFQRGRSVTLVNEDSCIVKLTDSGMEDGHGRRLFYQEEWVTRSVSLFLTTGFDPGGVMMLMRWAVEVDTKTGQHILLRRFKPREFRGSLDQLDKFPWSDYVSDGEVPETSALLSPADLTAALAAVERARDELRDAVANHKREVHEALMRNDALLASQNKPVLDDELPVEVRENLFAIRSHLGHVTSIVNAGNQVRRAAERVAGSVRILEALVAWVNGNALEQRNPARDSRALLETLDRSDAVIHMTRSLELAAITALPPDLSAPEAQFPALMRDVIVRIRRSEAPDAPGETATCKQEVWRRTGPGQGAGKVKRTIVHIAIEARTGNQIATARDVKYYLLDRGESIEEIYDENAAQ